MKHFLQTDIEKMEQRFRATFINSLGGFKSFSIVGTADVSGATNLAAFSSLFHIGANPPLCGLIVRPDDGAERHTLANIEKTGVYTFNHVNESFYKKAHQTSARYPKSVSEFDAVGLTPFFVDGLVAPFVAESEVKFALEIREITKLTINKTILLIGEIIHVVLPERIVRTDGFVDLEMALTITCSGLDSYHTTRRLSRLSYAKPDTFPTEFDNN
jgi:flavin reductase (DIM6/NTAB) family NADH-FMN oxidoreductase RutF